MILFSLGYDKIGKFKYKQSSKFYGGMVLT